MLEPAQGVPVATDSVRVEALAAYLPSRPAKAMTEVLPSQWVDLITEADSVDCYLLRPGWVTSDPSRPTDQRDFYFNPWAIRQRGQPLSKENRALLKSIILDPHSYVVPQSLGVVKGCIVDYNIGYLFVVTSERSDMVERVMVSICHSCVVMSIKLRGSNITTDIDYAGDALLQLSKALFPDDSEIDALFEKQHGSHNFRQR